MSNLKAQILTWKFWTDLVCLIGSICFFFSSKVCLCKNTINGSICNVTFWVWLFGTVHLRFMHYYMFCSFLLLSGVLLNGFTRVCLSLSQLRDIWIYFQFWVIVKKLPNTFTHRLLCEHRLSFHLGKHLGSRIAGLSGKWMLNFVRNCIIVFQSACTILHAHQQCVRLPVALRTC